MASKTVPVTPFNRCSTQWKHYWVFLFELPPLYLSARVTVNLPRWMLRREFSETWVGEFKGLKKQGGGLVLMRQGRKSNEREGEV